MIAMISTRRWGVRGRIWFGRESEIVIQWVVWLAAATLVIVMLAQRTGPRDLPGIARGQIVQLSVPWDSRVRAMPIEPFQPVQRGEVVALLDDSVVQGQIRAVEGEIERLRAEHAENQAMLESDTRRRRARWNADARAFESDAADLGVALHEARMDLEYDRALLHGLRTNVAHLDRLVERGHSTPNDLTLARAEAEATSRRVEEGERLVADLEARQRAAEERGEAYRSDPPDSPSTDPAALHLRNAIAVQQGLLDELLAQREQCVLRAPFDGTAIEIQGRAADASLRRAGEGNMRRPGEAVGAGDPIVVIASSRPTEVVAWVPEHAGREIRRGLAVTLTTTGPPHRIAEATVSAVGAAVERLPDRLWRQLQVPEWGRPVVIPLPPELTIAAGERVEVRLR